MREGKVNSVFPPNFFLIDVGLHYFYVGCKFKSVRCVSLNYWPEIRQHHAFQFCRSWNGDCLAGQFVFPWPIVLIREFAAVSLICL